MGKPRMVRSDVWRKRPAVLSYWAYADDLRLQARQKQFNFPLDGCHIRFLISMPESWSKRKRRELENQPHQQKPDIDNLVKGVMDALLDDDAGVWRISADKLWSVRSGIIVYNDETRPGLWPP